MVPLIIVSTISRSLTASGFILTLLQKLSFKIVIIQQCYGLLHIYAALIKQIMCGYDSRGTVASRYRLLYWWAQSCKWHELSITHSCSVHCIQNDFQLPIFTYLCQKAISRTIQCHHTGTSARLEKSEIDTSYFLCRFSRIQPRQHLLLQCCL